MKSSWFYSFVLPSSKRLFLGKSVFSLLSLGSGSAVYLLVIGNDLGDEPAVQKTQNDAAKAIIYLKMAFINECVHLLISCQNLSPYPIVLVLFFVLFFFQNKIQAPFFSNPLWGMVYIQRNEISTKGNCVCNFEDMSLWNQKVPI